jgi:hypothetical protein
VLSARYYRRDQIREDEMDVTRKAYERRDTCVENFSQKS